MRTKEWSSQVKANAKKLNFGKRDEQGSDAERRTASKSEKKRKKLRKRASTPRLCVCIQRNRDN